MRHKLFYGGSVLATYLALTTLPAALADTTSVTTRTTTNDAATSFILPPSTYEIVDPLTGAVHGQYIQGSRLIDGLPLTDKYVIMDKASRKLVATFDSSGNLLGLRNAPAAETVIVSVDGHRLALEKQIDDLVLKGQLSTSRADDLRLEISNLFPGHTTLSRTTTYDRALTADSGLFTVESHLIPLAPKAYAAVIEPTFLATDGQIILPDNLTHRKIRLEQKMNQQFASGHLTADQMVGLKTDMTEIYNRENSYRVTGLMSDGDAALLAIDLNAFQSKLERLDAN
jgi:hypothetical protein